ncbi:MAG TPA: serine/threonine-protein kinase [Polyangiaceae bacterium]
MPTLASPPGREIGRYLLFGEIASGGMATVHFGRLSGPAGFSRTVAIKRLHPQFAKDPEFVTMFLDEARLAARIRHPNVMPTLDVVATDSEIFLVMEYVQGESLARLLRSMRAMMTPADTRIVATVLAGVCHGLHAAHEAKDEMGAPLQIVHRDVSPQNVLVGVDGVPRVLDFGVAKAAGRLQTTREGQIKGKLSYMAPEQLHGAAVTRQTDVYAAAVVAWEALTGQRLFLGDNEGAVVTAILQKPLKPPSEVATHVPLAFDRVVLRGLERDPAKRYATARELAVDLERCAGVASASEVGEWVESVARDELLKRATRVAEIESASSGVAGRSAQWLPFTGEMPTTVGPPPVDPANAPWPGPSEVRSDVSSIAVSPILPTTPRRPPTRLALIVGGASAAALSLFLLVLFLHHGSGPAPEATGATEPAASPSLAISTVLPAEALPAAQSAEPEPETAPTGSAVAVASEATATAAPAPAPTVTPVRHHGYAPAPPHPARPTADCDPPFTIDAVGHKHYKAACLQ